MLHFRTENYVHRDLELEYLSCINKWVGTKKSCSSQSKFSIIACPKLNYRVIFILKILCSIIPSYQQSSSLSVKRSIALPWNCQR